MDGIKRIEGLDIDEDISHQKKMWKIERISWIIMALFIIAALAGFLGTGYFSKRMHNIGENSKVEYHFFQRYSSVSELNFYIKAGAGYNPISIALSQAYLKDAEIKRIEPEPASTEIIDDFYKYNFVNSSAAGLHILFYLEPKGFGTQTLSIIINGKNRTEIKQFVYP
ncbi:MAG TPA: hypothetical protein VHP30_13605 [Ignavibacteriales bacterium]|nr:hypothetical protein [Ignavibacteriales bacterium]